MVYRGASALFFVIFLLIVGNTFAQDKDSVMVRYFKEKGLSLDSANSIALYDASCAWLGVPYRYGVCTPTGTDCSGFTKWIYRNVYKIELYGGSADIYNKVKKVDEADRKEGDLVFFRISKGRISHVGVYLQNDYFIHASTKLGVIISSLNEPYYKKYYAGAGRLED